MDHIASLKVAAFRHGYPEKRPTNDGYPPILTEYHLQVRRAGRRYFELLDGRGWVFDWHCWLIDERGHLVLYHFDDRSIFPEV